MKRNTDDIVGIITAYVSVGILLPSVLLALNRYPEYGDWFLSSMLFIIFSYLHLRGLNQTAARAYRAALPAPPAQPAYDGPFLPATAMPRLHLFCFAFLLLPFLATAQTHVDPDAARARETLKQRANDPEQIDNCFVAGNPFPYCIYLDEQEFRFRVVDRHLQEPYQVYQFDGGPDSPEEGRYRIRLNGKIGFADEETGAIVVAPIYDCAFPYKDGKASVGFGCKEKSDGEHRWWSGGKWQHIDRQGKVIDQGAAQPGS